MEGTKTCAKCGETKPRAGFYKRTESRDGLKSCCKACASAHSAKYRAEHAEAVRAAEAKRYAANPFVKRLRSAKYRSDHPEAVCIHSHNYRARKVGGKLSKDIAARLFTLQRGKCACGCEQPLGKNFHRDHRMPLALGGANEDWNIQLLRQSCNQQKSAKHPVNFMQERGFLI